MNEWMDESMMDLVPGVKEKSLLLPFFIFRALKAPSGRELSNERETERGCHAKI